MPRTVLEICTKIIGCGIVKIGLAQYRARKGVIMTANDLFVLGASLLLVIGSGSMVLLLTRKGKCPLPFCTKVGELVHGTDILMPEIGKRVEVRECPTHGKYEVFLRDIPEHELIQM